MIAGQVARVSRVRNIYRSLLLILATATQKELARYVSYLKEENKILRRRLPERVLVEPNERRRLVRLGAKLGRALDELVTIVHPGTLRRWIREDSKTTKLPRGKVGRRRTGEQTAIVGLPFENSRADGTARLPERTAARLNHSSQTPRSRQIVKQEQVAERAIGRYGSALLICQRTT
jgi:hypothetical protein